MRLLYPFVVKGNFELFCLKRWGEPEDKPGDRCWVAWNDSAWANEVEKAPLSTRAWIVQERFLATRIIHFSQNQIFFECLENNSCSIDPDYTLMTTGMIRSCATTTYYKSARLQIERCTTTDLEGRLRQELYKKWVDIISVYAHCDLTKESDRLVALSGITKMFQEARGATCVAGLWKDMMYQDLTWKSRASQGIATRRATFYAPSWSWMAIVGGQVQFSSHRTVRPLIKLLEVHATADPPDGDPVVSLRSARLDIECVQYYYRWDQRHKELILYGDEMMTESLPNSEGGLLAGKGVLHLDTSDLVDRFAEADKMEGMCISLVAVKFRSRSLRQYLMVEPDGNDRYTRIGLIESEAKDTAFDKRNRVSITLI
ncbi:hypothetical protein ANO14919_079290 [Xylariales sp. No.14919]|nr:hypothetical protein ANO14919_079290 [Xylariales sp. No.14919]